MLRGTVKYLFVALAFLGAMTAKNTTVGMISDYRSPSGSLRPLVGDYLRETGGSALTIRAKERDLLLFEQYLSGQQVFSLSNVAKVHVESFVAHRLSFGDKPSTVVRRLDHIKHFLKHIEQEHPGFKSPARNVKAPKISNRKYEGLSVVQVAELREVVAAARGKSFSACRTHFVVELLLNTGLRRQEATRLQERQLGQDLAKLHDVWGKGNSWTEELPLNARLRPILRHYLARRFNELAGYDPIYRAAEPLSRTRAVYPLIVSTYHAEPGRPETFQYAPESLARAVKTAAKKAGIPPHLRHPHTLRHTFARTLLDSTNNIRLVSKALRHSSLEHTMRYTDYTQDELKDALDEI